MKKNTFSLFVVLGFFLIPCTNSIHARPWQRLENCQLLNNPFNDGDSFHVRANGRERIFRLYFVDCPETSDHNSAMKKRILEQSKEFGKPAQEIMKLGKTAARFTTGLLKNAGTFTVITRWEDALGDSNIKRNFAYIIVNGRGLDEQLLEAGLARVLGYPVDIPATVLPPNGINGFEHRKKLIKIQEKAKRNKVGAW